MEGAQHVVPENDEVNEKIELSPAGKNSRHCDEVRAPRRFKNPMDREGLLLTVWSQKCNITNIKSVVMQTLFLSPGMTIVPHIRTRKCEKMIMSCTSSWLDEAETEETSHYAPGIPTSMPSRSCATGYVTFPWQLVIRNQPWILLYTAGPSGRAV